MNKLNSQTALVISHRMAALTAEMERAAPGAALISKMPKPERERQKYYQYYLELKEMLRDSVKETSDPDFALILRASVALVAIRLKELQSYTTSQHQTRQ